MSCSHAACRCDDAPLEREGRNYCSERCADVDRQSDPGGACPCGHPDCAAL